MQHWWITIAMEAAIQPQTSIALMDALELGMVSDIQDTANKEFLFYKNNL